MKKEKSVKYEAKLVNGKKEVLNNEKELVMFLEHFELGPDIKYVRVLK